jgi:ASC-1-like (ASCH) protein
MKHKMGLFERPFNSIKSGRKTVEVVGLRKYATFKEMYEDIPYKDFDAAGKSIEEMVERTYKIYSPEQEKEWGTLAITIKY